MKVVFRPEIFFIQIVMILLLVGILLFLFREMRAIRLQKRFEPFSLLPVSRNEKSVLDKLYQRLGRFIKILSRVLSHSAVLQKYSKRYERFISFEEKDMKSPMDYIAAKLLVGTLLLLLNILALLFRQTNMIFLTCLCSFLIGFFIPDILLRVQFGKKKKMVEEDLLKAIMVMNNSFKSGRTIMQAVEIVKNELDGPIKDEFQKIYMDMTYGLSVDVVFSRFYDRVKLEEIKYITSSLSLLNYTGGNIARVFGTIEKSFFSKKKLANEMKSLTAASNFMYKVLVALPIIFTLVICILNPSYFLPFFTSAFGIILFILTIGLYITYVYLIKKELKVKM